MTAAPDNFLERMNEQATQELDAEARHSRGRFLQLSGIVLKELLETQALNLDVAETGEKLEYWVRRDLDAVPPAQTGLGRVCLSFMLEGYNFFQGRRERLRVLVPVEKHFNQDDPATIEAMPEPDVVYTERSLTGETPGAETVISRYAVERERAFPYKLEDGEMVEDIGDISMEQFMSRQVPDDLTRLVRLRLDMVRYKARPQRESHMGNSSPTDV